MTGTSWTYTYLVQTVLTGRGYSPPLADHPPPPNPHLICVTHDIKVAVKKVAHNPTVLAS